MSERNCNTITFKQGAEMVEEVVYDLDTLRDGFRFELEVAGITYWGGKKYPQDQNIPLEDAVSEVINSKIEIKKEDSLSREIYNPAKPEWGLLPILFEKVKKRLKESRKFAPQTLKELRLYIAIGSKLDFFYGTDLLFTLKKAIVRIDISLMDKHKFFLIQPSDVSDDFKEISKRAAHELMYQYKLNRRTRSLNPGGDVS